RARGHRVLAAAGARVPVRGSRRGGGGRHGDRGRPPPRLRVVRRRRRPHLASGQVHGGLAQGIAQALWEELRYGDDGQLITGSLMDYAVPRADDLPSFRDAATVTPTPRNPLGAKGIGEAATIGSTPAVVNAVVDALRSTG